jgi:KUP system potassium uptake protein
VNIVNELVPRVAGADRFTVEDDPAGVWRVTARFGFMEKPNLEPLLPDLKRRCPDLDLSKVVYYVPHDSVVGAKRGQRQMFVGTEALFAFMHRNQAHLTDVLSLPADKVIEVGRRIEL